MSRTKGARNKRTLLREAQIRQRAIEAAGMAKATDDGTILLDSTAVMETGMRYFIERFNAGRACKKPNPDRVAADLRDAMAIAREANPYRYARLAVMKLATDPNTPKLDQVSKEELRRQIILEAAELGLFDATNQLTPAPAGVASRSDDQTE
jgi:hypothetical protein